MTTLGKIPSSEIVRELARHFGDTRARQILEVTPARLQTLVDRRGCLKDSQLKRITEVTDIAWQKWGIEAGARQAKTAKNRAFVEATRAMWDQIESKERPPRCSSPITKTRRPQRLAG